MDSVPLTPRERDALNGIEAGLRRHRMLDRRLRTMRCRLPGSAALARTALCCAFLASLALLVAAATTASTAWTAAFAVVWPATLVLAALMLRGWSRRHL